MFERVKHMIIKEFIHVFRDKRMKAMLFGIPVLQMLAFGYAVTTDVRNIQTAVYDLDRSYESREIVRRLESSGYFEIKRLAESPAEIQELLDRGKVVAAVQINRGFSADLKRGVRTEIQVLIDGTDSNTGIVAMDYAGRVIMQYAKDIRMIYPPHPNPLPQGERENKGRRFSDDHAAISPPLMGGVGEGDILSFSKIDLRTRVWYNPELKSKNYNVPGVIAVVIMLTCLLLTAMAVVREREIGTMEQLMVTPLRPIELILGKTIPFAFIGFVDVLIVTAVGLFWFDIPVNGPLGLLLLCTSVYLLSVLGMGLFISTISKTQQQALMATFFFYTPAVLLSGFMFPIENMPEVIRHVTYLNPLRHFLIIIRGIFLKGNGFDILWPQLAALLVLGIFVITLSSMRFRKRLG